MDSTSETTRRASSRWRPAIRPVGIRFAFFFGCHLTLVLLWLILDIAMSSSASAFEIEARAVMLAEHASEISLSLARVGFYAIPASALATLFATGVLGGRRRRWPVDLAVFACLNTGMLLTAIRRYPQIFAKSSLGPETLRIVAEALPTIGPFWVMVSISALALCCHLLLHRRLPGIFAAVAILSPLALEIPLSFALGYTPTQLGKGGWATAEHLETRKPAQNLGAANRSVFILAGDSLRGRELADPEIRRQYMPFLDRLIKEPSEFAYFPRAFAASTRTLPSWLEIYTGRYSSSFGLDHMFPTVAARKPSLPNYVDLLHANGYTTAAISDNAGEIFPRLPVRFDKIYSPNLTMSQILFHANIGKQVTLLPFLYSPLLLRTFPSLWGNANYADPRVLTDVATDFVKSYKKDNIFLTIFYSIAHFPYPLPYPDYHDAVEPNYRGPFRLMADHALTTTREPDAADRAQAYRLYLGAYRAFDREVERFVSFLRDSGLYDDAAIIILSDHGESLYHEPYCMGHGDHLYGQGVLHVPLLVKLPRGSAPLEAADVASLLDPLASVATVLFPEQPLPPTSHAVSLLSRRPDRTVMSQSEIWFSDKVACSYQNQRLIYPGAMHITTTDPSQGGEVVLREEFADIVRASRHRSLIRWPYKLLYEPAHTGVRWSLFHLENDPNAADDIAASYPQVVAELKAIFQDELKRELRLSLRGDYVVP